MSGRVCVICGAGIEDRRRNAKVCGSSICFKEKNRPRDRKRRLKSSYTAAVGEAICSMISEGACLRLAAERAGVSRRTVRCWIERNPKFKAAMDRALVLGLEHHFGQIITIADAVQGSDDAPAVNAARLQIDARKWMLVHMAPQRYGAMLQITKPLTPAEVDRSKVALSSVAPSGGITKRLRIAGLELALRQRALAGE